MNRSILMSALFLTACATPDFVVPDELLTPVTITCRNGTTSRAFGQCAIDLRRGLTEANSKITAIDRIVNGE